MKLAALVSRGLRRDFWDLYELLVASLQSSDLALSSLEQALDDYLKRFGVSESDVYDVLRALAYFDDAEKDELMPAGLTMSHWETMKAYFVEQAPNALRRRVGR
jgi:hypothetical protein